MVIQLEKSINQNRMQAENWKKMPQEKMLLRCPKRKCF
jgi:hypothetical protein